VKADLQHEVPYLARHLSVRKVVLTLTSESAEIYPSMAGVKQLGDTRFILVPAGAVRTAGMCSGHCIALHRSACRGVLQARRERRLVLQVPEVLIEASANIGVKAGGVRVRAVRLCVRPLQLGDCTSFYRPRRGQFTGVPHYSPTCEGMACSAVELTTVPANLAPVGVSWRVLCPYKSGFEGGGVEVARPPAARVLTRRCRCQEDLRGTVVGVAMSCPRAP
jgi:hypothetical protein